MTLSTPWLALVGGAALALLVGGLREIATRTRSEDVSGDGRDRGGAVDGHRRTTEVTA